MTITTQIEKKKAALIKMGNTLKQQRTIIAKSDITEFVNKMNLFSDFLFTNDLIEKMEIGYPVSIEYWIYVWLYFQNLDKIVLAYDAKEMMFLSQQEFLSNIEEEMINYHKKGTGEIL
jgi:hypothetical protein